MLKDMLAGLSSFARLAGYRLTRKKPQKTYTPNGERECARRRRQIPSGQLTEANGLWRV